MVIWPARRVELEQKTRVFASAVLLTTAFVWPLTARAVELASAELLIAGTVLRVSPESQTVPFSTPTQIDTHLDGYDPELGVLPSALVVRGDFTGPEIDGVLVLETTPNQPFRVPRLQLLPESTLRSSPPGSARCSPTPR